MIYLITVARKQETEFISKLWDTVLVALLDFVDDPKPWSVHMGRAGMAAAAGFNYVDTEFGFELQDNKGDVYVAALVYEGQVTVYPSNILFRAFDLLDEEIELEKNNGSIT